MTVSELTAALGVTPLAMPDPEREVTGAYAGDLLSWVMGRAKEGNVWVTVMTNANTIAVATLSDSSLIIISDGSDVPGDIIALAEEKGVNLAKAELSTYELCVQIGKLLS